MLIKLKSDYDKIAMGLLSYIPDLGDMTRLTDVFNFYKEDETRQLFLWRSDETDDLCAIVGIEETEELILVHHLSMNPSYRGEGLTYCMLDQLSKAYPNRLMVGTIETKSFIRKWQDRQHIQHTNAPVCEDE